MFSSNKSLRVVKELLKRKEVKQQDLACYAGVSIGLVNKVVKRLRDSSLVTDGGTGVSLRDHARLLTFFSVEFPLTRRLHRTYTSQLAKNETIELLSEKMVGLDYAYTILTALPKYSAAASGEAISFYVDVNQLDQADELLDSLGFTDKGSGSVIDVYVGKEGILYDAADIGGAKYVSREQLLIDLYSSTQYNYIAVQVLKEYLEQRK